jgi:hypothetical protein
VNAGRQHPVLGDETKWGTDYCIAIAEGIVEAERGARVGKVDTEMSDYTRKEAWARFENLERGPMSNGVERPDRRS